MYWDEDKGHDLVVVALSTMELRPQVNRGNALDLEEPNPNPRPKRRKTQAEFQREYRQRQKEKEGYAAYIENEQARSRLWRLRRSDQGKVEDRELSRLRMQQYRRRKKAAGLHKMSSPKPAKKITRSVGQALRKKWRLAKQKQRKKMSAQKRRRVIKLEGKRKASTLESSVCTICGVTVRPVELPAHYEIEVDRLNKLTRPGKSSREASTHTRKVHCKKSPNGIPSTSTSKRKKENEEEGLENTESRQEEHKRVKRNRRERLNARLGRCRKGLKKPCEDAPSSAALCPICHEVLTGSAEDRNIHAEACLRKVTPGQVDVDGEVDVDGDDEFEEYTWCGQTRVRATSMLDSRFREAGFEVGCKETDCETVLNVDDDDTAEYGPEQFTEADIIPCPSDDSTEDKQRQALRDAVVGNDERANPLDSVPDPWLPSTSNASSNIKEPNRTDVAGTARSSTVVDCLKARVRELQNQLDSATAARIKCLICMESFSVPLVSIQCWHVHCQQCWLRTLGAKKLCPQCNMITSSGQLRRIYL